MQLSRALSRSGALAAALLLSACATSGRRGGAGEAPASLDFELPDVAGRVVRTEAMRGRVLLVDVWATWCGPCEASMPFYTRLHERLSSRGLTILAVSVDEKDSDVTSYLERKPLPFAILRDPKGTVPSRLDVAMETMPTSILIGGDGRVLHVHSGFVESDEADIERRVEAALAALDRAPGDSARESSE